ncbi:molybdopterin synthase large subunit CnxH [Aspergillus cavernicola]|uniref:Molybdopterin synthase catalytic subunit n=1 Tax=Aspergillus cavernicola TaxID=176166 RepID=A0ABR4IV37_9EURO
MSTAQPESQPQNSSNAQGLPPHLNPWTYPRTLSNTHNNSPIHLELTYSPLDPTTALSTISSTAAGANVLFLGTTRDTFEDRPVAQLSYTTYPQLALKTLDKIAKDAIQKYGLNGVHISHRLGVVPVKEASIIVAISAGHRGEAWRSAEEILEIVKEKLEVWKREEFVDGGIEWRENRERDSSGNLISKSRGVGKG